MTLGRQISWSHHGPCFGDVAFNQDPDSATQHHRFVPLPQRFIQVHPLVFPSLYKHVWKDDMSRATRASGLRCNSANYHESAGQLERQNQPLAGLDHESRIRLGICRLRALLIYLSSSTYPIIVIGITPRRLSMSCCLVGATPVHAFNCPSESCHWNLLPIILGCCFL